MVLELLCVCPPWAAGAAPAMKGLGAIRLKDLSLAPPMVKNCSSSSSSLSLRFHQQKNKINPTMIPTPATHPMTIPAMLPPDKELEPDLACLCSARSELDSEEVARDGDDLTVVVISTTEELPSLALAVAVEMSVLVFGASEDEEEDECSVGEADEEKAGSDEEENDEVDGDDSEELVGLREEDDEDEEDDDDEDVVELEVELELEEDDVDDEEPPKVEASASALT